MPVVRPIVVEVIRVPIVFVDTRMRAIVNYPSLLMKIVAKCMGYGLFRKIIALVLLVAIAAFAFDGPGSAHAMDDCGQASYGKADVISANDFSADDTPCCPGNAATLGDCCSCHLCPCHAPLAPGAVQFRYSPVVLNYPVSESSKGIPEVYLSIFVPPQNLA